MTHVLAVTAVVTAVFAVPHAQPTTATATADQQADGKKWDVNADLGPVQKVAFDTSEGNADASRRSATTPRNASSCTGNGK